MWIAVVLFLAVIILVILLLRRNYGTLEKCGFPVIPPTLCLGSGPFQLHKISLVDMDMDRFRKYGKVYGAYILSTPWVFISDADIIRQIIIKDFSSFPGHSFTLSNQKYRTLDLADGEEWRELRKGLSPIFTSGKIKGMMTLLDGALDNMVSYLNKEVKESAVIDMKTVFQKMTMDVIAKCAFGIEVNCFEDPNNMLLHDSREVFEEFLATDFKTNLLANFTLGMMDLDKYINFPPGKMADLWNYTKQVQEQREKSDVKLGDFIDKLGELKAIIQKGVVTEDQLTAQGIIFIIAGFETTANTLGSLSYQLVNNPEVYAQLVAEVDDILERFDGVVNHETIAEMPYLEGCIKEALRMLPPVARNDRKCAKDWEYKGIKIKEGTNIGLPLYIVHHNPEYWPEPELFKPERFFKENAGNIVPCSFLPFGSGPRACIGERFAITEIKVAMTRLLQHFHLEKDEKTRMNLRKGDLFMSSYTDMYIRLVPRQ